MIAIGFTTEYFTLWHYQEEKHFTTIGNNTYQTGSTFRYSYIKNISKDESKVKSLYPNLVIDFDLKGSQSFTLEKSIEMPDEYYKFFNFGKYYGKKIEECTDLNYLIWFYENAHNQKSAKYAFNILSKNGYVINEFGSIEHISEIEKRKAIEFEKHAFEVNFNKEYTFDCLVENNPNSEGDIWLNGIPFRFNKVVENHYNGYNYYLPVLNGKTKRIKNKNVRFTAIKQNDIYIDIINFQIIK